MRIKTNLKRTAEKIAVEENTTLQYLFNRALEDYLETKARKIAKKIVFKTHNLGNPLDNLRRKDFYPSL